MEANGFRRLLLERTILHVIELPEMGNLDDGKPFAVKVRQLRPIEYWVNRFGDFCDLPIFSGKRPDEDEETSASADSTRMLRHYEWSRALVGMALTHIRDVDADGVETWVPVAAVKDSSEIEEKDGKTIVGIELLERGSVIRIVADAIIDLANFGGHQIKEDLPQGG